MSTPNVIDRIADHLAALVATEAVVASCAYVIVALLLVIAGLFLMALWRLGDIRSLLEYLADQERERILDEIADATARERGVSLQEFIVLLALILAVAGMVYLFLCIGEIGRAI